MLLAVCTCVAYAQVAMPSADRLSEADTRMREVFAQAESDFRIGRIEQARDTLMQHLSTFHGNLRQGALRLIALTYLARFDISQTERYVALLLDENPYYSPSAADPPTFADIVSNIKAGRTATITTASIQAESLAEVPVPATLITAEMIENSGARNLQEVLAAYVPGMHIVDCNDDINIAMRGIYSNTQEKILIMLNGHRLNSYSTNTAAPDFSISLHEVKQIEVLRGPASSLYGSVALTAVVNIITKQGADVDGLQVRAGIGNYHQVKANAVLGKRYFDIDLLAWASVYRNSGEKRYLDEELMGGRELSDFTSDKRLDPMPVDHIRIGRIGDHPTYDFGLQLGYKGLQFMYDTHFSQVVSPFTMTTLALSYDHDRYRTFNGLKPCFSSNSHHVDLGYSHQVGNVQLKYGATYDKSDQTRYQVISDDPSPFMTMVVIPPADMIDVLISHGGIFRYVNGQEQNYSFQLKGNYAYTLGRHHCGNLSFGAEYGHFQLDDITYQMGIDFEKTYAESPAVHNAGKGSENSADAYLQLKHQWRSLILNAGMRYDYKARYDDSHVHEFSPRVALIVQRPRWNTKLSYSESFVDAPYIYRKGNVITGTIYKDDEDYQTVYDLSPEIVHSLQLSFAGNNWLKGLDFEVNGFLNYAHDLILTDMTFYTNASKNNTLGLELAASYKLPKLTVNWNFTWIHTIRSNLVDAESFLPKEIATYCSSDVDDNNNTPAVMSNLVLAWQATPRLKLRSHLLFEGKQTAYIANVESYILSNIFYNYYGNPDKYPGNSVEYYRIAVYYASNSILPKDMPARAILNIGADYRFGPVTIGLDVHNLLGTRYDRSGMNTNLIPQQGRWFMGTIGVNL